MKKPLKVLIIEDSENDAVLLIRELEKGGYDPVFRRVDTAEAVRDAIQEQQWEVVISDYMMLQFDGLSALRVVKESGLDLPFILISGQINEETAVAAMKAGAHDYITKGKMARLIPAIERELKEAEIRRERSRIEKELHEYHNNLEKIVGERTAEWKDATEKLLLEIEGHRKTEKALQSSNVFLEKIMENVTNAIYVLDLDGRIVQINHAAFEISGYTVEELTGKPLSIIFDKRTLSQIEKLFARVVRTGETIINYETEIVRKDGERRSVIASGVPLKTNGTITGLIGAAQDITERKKMEEEITHLAHHDALTGLPNRRLFMDIVHGELAQARRNHKRLAILFLDLDRFKEINDTLGHKTGDEMLKAISVRLKANIRESDRVARIGGDEFNVILADIARVEDISAVTNKIMNSFRKPFMIAGHELHMTTSIGISVYPDDGEEIDTLFRYADIAMYHAKETGKNTYQFYNPEINIRTVERMKMEGWMRRAIERGELTVYYQPQINIRTNKIVSAEALVRWEHPKLGLLEPNRFIPLAEETGFIISIDEWVMRNVCQQSALWQADGMPPLCMTVNLSARQFQNPELVNKVSQILDETGMDPDCLDIEITESLAMSNVESTAIRLRELSEMGVHISIDDFGTGYSSLSYLKRLPIERLKIDKSFIQDITTDPDDRAIINAVTAMAHNMRMKVIAEGVETEEQLSFVHSSDCDEVQGYLFSRPLPEKQFRNFYSSYAH
jgi:diguanylate cyclase (GGDEF)-like protein/PAS domain S-box-containing protein